MTMSKARPTSGAMSRRALNRATLARQMLLRRESVGVVAAVERLAGLQAQVPKPPFIGLWTRLNSYRREDLLDAILRRQVARATLMRGTLHLMSRADLVALRPALEPMLARAPEIVLRDRARGIDPPALLTAAMAFLAHAPCTFEALRDHLAAGFPKLDVRAMGYIVRMRLPLIMVPDAAALWGYPANAAFALAEPWLASPFASDAAPDALVRRYLAAFGPASAADLQVWSGLPGMKGVLERLRPSLMALRDDRGRELFDLPDAPRPDESVAAPVRFLPEFDNLLLAHVDRSRVIDDVHRRRVITANLRILATFLVDGAVAGTWSTAVKKGAGRLTIQPFITLSAATRRELEAEGDALLRFVEPTARTFAVEIARRQ